MTETTTAPRAKTLAAQRAVNLLVRGLLRTPLLARLVGRRLIIIYVIGRKSGRRLPVPVAYVRQDGVLLVGTPFGWGRNLRTGELVDVRLQGRRRTAVVEVLVDEAGVVDGYATMSRNNHAFAKFNRIRLDDAGEPDPQDLQLAWKGGARLFRLVLQ